jgi:hypothetical protein
MPRFKPKGVLERDALADLWKHTLSQIPSIYGRLAYLASLRDANSGYYRHHGLSAAFGRDESGKALKESHERTFLEWLNLPLAEKSVDLNVYMQALDDEQRVVARNWLRSGHHKMQAPDRASRAQKAHFQQELETLLEMITNQAGAEPRSPDSSQPE